MDKRVLELFKIRDKAVLDRDKKLFLSTQIREIPRAFSNGYLSIDRMVTKVFYAHHDEMQDNVLIVLVQERYYKKQGFSHYSYLVYSLVDLDGKLYIVQSTAVN